MNCLNTKYLTTKIIEKTWIDFQEKHVSILVFQCTILEHLKIEQELKLLETLLFLQDSLELKEKKSNLTF